MQEEYDNTLHLQADAIVIGKKPLNEEEKSTFFRVRWWGKKLDSLDEEIDSTLILRPLRKWGFFTLIDVHHLPICGLARYRIFY